MKKHALVFLTFLETIAMTSCSDSKVYSLKEACGFEITDISGASVSSSVYQNFCWDLSSEAFSYLDCKYIKVDFDICENYLSKWPPSELEDDAYVLHMNIKDVELYTDFGPVFYVSHNTGFMYFDGIDGTYRSRNQMPSDFISKLNNR